MRSGEIIKWMEQHGWEFKASDIISSPPQVVVFFQRADWHGRRLNKAPVAVTRYGSPKLKEELIRLCAKEAIWLWNKFQRPPGRFFNPETRQTEWRVK